MSFGQSTLQIYEEKHMFQMTVRRDGSNAVSEPTINMVLSHLHLH